MVKTLTCVACPIGCALSAQIEAGEVTGVSGNACKRCLLYTSDAADE